MQKSYLVKQSVDFGQGSKFLIRPGDILVYDSQNQNKITVYRNGDIAKVLANQSLSGLSGLLKVGWLSEIHPNDIPKHNTATPKATAKAAQKPAPAMQKSVSVTPPAERVEAVETPKKRIADTTV